MFSINMIKYTIYDYHNFNILLTLSFLKIPIYHYNEYRTFRKFHLVFKISFQKILV